MHILLYTWQRSCKTRLSTWLPPKRSGCLKTCCFLQLTAASCSKVWTVTSNLYCHRLPFLENRAPILKNRSISLFLRTKEWHRIKVLFNSTSTWCQPLFPYIILLTFTSVVALWADRLICLVFACGHFCIPMYRKQCKGLIIPCECPDKIRHIWSVKEGWSECFLPICNPVTLLSR